MQRSHHRPRKQRVSAGLLMYRMRGGELEVFIAHPGGPWFPYKDRDVWTIPKGELEPGEEPFEAAIREFQEEVGIVPHGPYIELGFIRQKGGKTVFAWAFEGDWDEEAPLESARFSIEWPPESGQIREFPEIDRAAFFPVDSVRGRLKAAQHALVDRLLSALQTPSPEDSSD